MSRDKQIKNMAEEILQEYTNCYSEVDQELLEKMLGKLTSDVALETVDSFQRILRHIFLNMCDGNDYERLNLLQIDGAIEALYDSFTAELKKKYESEGEG